MKLVKLSDHSVDIDLIDKDSIVFDVGSYQGDFVRDLLKYHKCKIFMYEPNYRQTKMTSLYGNMENIIINYKAISSKEGKRKLYLGNKTGFGWVKQTGSSFYPSHSNVGKIAIEVVCTSIEKEMKNYKLDNIDLLKIDVEGEELEIIKSLDKETFNKIGQITIEFHEHNNIDGYTEDKVKECREIIKSRGFKEIVASNLDNLYIKKELLK